MWLRSQGKTMPSPFPGMDPYLEAHWRDIHARLVIYASDALQGALPSPLRARVAETVLLENPQALAGHPRLPDVSGTEETSSRGPGTSAESGVAVAAPFLVDAEPEPVTEPFIEIIDRESGNRVVTVIEFLSPSNKTPGANRDQYLRKQSEICSSDTSLVEIDLNRFGVHTLVFPLFHLKPQARTPYMASVRRATRRDKAQVYPMPLWQPLPTVQIPLRPDDTDVPLNVQALVDQCYRNGGYEGTLNYAADPDPPLVGADKEWADTMLRDKGLRPRTRPPRRRGKGKSR
jgi:hypothetical protein